MEKIHSESSFLSLQDLRRLFGRRLDASRVPSQEVQIRPGYWRKVYGLASPEQWVYRATNQNLKGRLRPLKEIAKYVDNRPLLELLEERDGLVKQLCARAACGDVQALNLLISTARGVISALDSLEKAQPAKVHAAAEGLSAWPVLISLNPQDIRRAKERLHRLKVGSRTTAPRGHGQKLDPQNFWTELATRALGICENNKIIVPELERFAAGARSERQSLKFWRTPAEATFYYVTEWDCIIITDWERQCVHLSKPITETNFKKWWSSIQFCVLELWHGSKNEYDAALAHFADRTAPKEFKKRNLALAQLRKAFKSLVGLRHLRG